MRVTYLLSNAAAMGVIPERKGATRSIRSEGAKAHPPCCAAVHALSGIGSQAPKTRSSRLGQRHEVANERHPVLSPLAEADGAHLGERADGLSEARA